MLEVINTNNSFWCNTMNKYTENLHTKSLKKLLDVTLKQVGQGYCICFGLNHESS